MKSLEAIELIIREKVELEEYQRSEDKKMRQRGLHIPLQDSVWKDCKSIYKWLSHHYIRRRSVVFIVDTQFDSVVYRDKAMKYVRSFYRNRLNEHDYFGYISLDDSQQAAQDEI